MTISSCHFCGSSDVGRGLCEADGKPNMREVVICRSCSAQGPRAYTETEAIERWNGSQEFKESPTDWWSEEPPWDVIAAESTAAFWEMMP